MVAHQNKIVCLLDNAVDTSLFSLACPLGRSQLQGQTFFQVWILTQCTYYPHMYNIYVYVVYYEIDTYMLHLVMRCNTQQDPCKNQRVSFCSWAGSFSLLYTDWSSVTYILRTRWTKSSLPAKEKFKREPVDKEYICALSQRCFPPKREKKNQQLWKWTAFCQFI